MKCCLYILSPLMEKPSAAAGGHQGLYPGEITQAPSCQLLTMVQWFQYAWRLLLHRSFSSHDFRVSHRKVLPYFFSDFFPPPVGTFIHCKFYFYLFSFFTHTAELKEICEGCLMAAVQHCRNLAETGSYTASLHMSLSV